MDVRLKVGDPAPDFEGSTSTDTRVRLRDYLGKKNVVLYFYPKDDTKGCTIEACSFRDKLQSIASLWTEVIGVSVDAVDSHKKFAEKNRLNFPLVSDQDRRISNAYGVLSEDGSCAEENYIHNWQGWTNCESLHGCRRYKAHARSSRGSQATSAWEDEIPTKKWLKAS